MDSTEPLGANEFMDSIWTSLIKLYGEHGASQAKLKLIDYDFEKKSAMLRTTNAALEMTRVALASITKINSKPAGLHVLSVSGTIKSLNSKRTRNHAEST